MWPAIKATYRNAVAFAIALPLLMALAIGFEALQHAVEWSIGMYADKSAALATQWHPARLIAGVAKIAVLTLLSYWVARFALGRSADATTQRDPVAERRFAAVLAFTIAFGIATLAVEVGLANSTLPRAVVAGALVTVLIGTTVLNIALSYWIVGAAVASPGATAMASLRASRGSLLWGIGLTIAAILPMMAIHYAFGGLAIGQPPALAIGMLAVDAIVVGFLSILIGAASVAIARHMAARHRLPLA